MYRLNNGRNQLKNGKSQRQFTGRLLWSVDPIFVNGSASRVHQPKVGLEGHLKSSSTHHDIKFVHLIVGCEYSLRHDLGNLSVEDWLDVWLYKGLQVAVSRGYPPAARRPLLE